ncbi:Kef-type potassium/proton antiporter (CPA2 family) [Nitrosomonas sp. Nm84]|uniref:monovalent cation:proton antiporter-2 (CPA2) family protein n=1 Tax=Nitrosomonas sp. Nm84 TaxID=200124 RepID=UPI000D76377D|nr:monovalent cation:proton antiporter-2 (CPA2) family protein [Nitrosomonas sp. Nm84]PXW83442.1 Kef-type potassium/proton antiporter (CPA2 family) [Nitrosomonas sp. Nm84]
MSEVTSPVDLLKVVTLLGAAVVMVPIFRRLGLGSVLGYLVAGLIIGPFGLQLFSDSHTILHVAELGVVMFLFVIGLEMRPSHLWSLRRDIFGLGSLQIIFCTIALTGIGIAFGFSVAVSFISAMGFVLTSTAIVMQLLEERGDIALPRGQKIVAILLFEDLLIIPLLAIVALMSPNVVESAQGSSLLAVAIGVGSLAGVIVCGVWLLNPLFRVLAMAKAREVMTAAALFVVLGSALLMQISGLSMAMGAFLAGVLLAESSFRHQIEADIEPFRGILLGLFFIGVGMSLNLDVVIESWVLILTATLAMMAIKALCIYIVARLSGTSNANAIDRMFLMAQGGEFAFVLFTAAAAASVIDATVNANMTAVVVLSMGLTPLFVAIYKKLAPVIAESKEDVEDANGLSGSVLLIGFGRFGQVISQLLLARNVDVTIIDSNPNMIRNASKFGFKIYYGDGSRLDVLRASGAHNARAILVCVDQKSISNRIVELVKSEFPLAKLLVRSFDRTHSRELVQRGVDFQIRETFESAFLFGQATLHELGVTEEEIAIIANDIRSRDTERFQLEIAGGEYAGRDLVLSNTQEQTPLLPPKREATALTQDTATEVNTPES